MPVLTDVNPEQTRSNRKVRDSNPRNSPEYCSPFIRAARGSVRACLIGLHGTFNEHQAGHRPEAGAARPEADTDRGPPFGSVVRVGRPRKLCEALDLHMRRHGDTAYRVRKALCSKGATVNVTTLGTWRRGSKTPSDYASTLCGQAGRHAAQADSSAHRPLATHTDQGSNQPRALVLAG